MLGPTRRVLLLAPMPPRRRSSKTCRRCAASAASSRRRRQHWPAQRGGDWLLLLVEQDTCCIRTGSRLRWPASNIWELACSSLSHWLILKRHPTHSPHALPCHHKKYSALRLSAAGSNHGSRPGLVRSSNRRGIHGRGDRAIH